MLIPPSPHLPPVERLLLLLAQLRSPEGCPWDREQTSLTLKPQLLEECYEVLEAIEEGNPVNLKEELGDLFLHIAYQTQIATEKNEFTFPDMVEALVEKLVRRHPHVYGAENVADASDTLRLWHQLKRKEKPERLSALDGVPRALPALLRAEALQKKARQVGFDWPDARGALAKVQEEVREVTAELAADLSTASAEKPFVPRPEAAEELGDLLFALVNLIRQLRWPAEELLTRANEKFDRRFRAVEKRMLARGKAPADCTLEELDAAWDEVKRQEKESPDSAGSEA